MLPPPAGIVAVCWTCGLPGIHGSLDDCLRDLRRAVAGAERDWRERQAMIARLRAEELTRPR